MQERADRLSNRLQGVGKEYFNPRLVLRSTKNTYGSSNIDRTTVAVCRTGHSCHNRPSMNFKLRDYGKILTMYPATM